MRLHLWGAIALMAFATACARTPEARTQGTSAFAQATAPADDLRSQRAERLKVALLAPVGIAEDAKADDLGLMLERAARLAMQDMAAPFELDVIDTGTGTPGIIQAAQRAVDGGSKLVVGPIYAADVATASAVTRPAGVPMPGLHLRHGPGRGRPSTPTRSRRRRTYAPSCATRSGSAHATSSCSLPRAATAIWSSRWRRRRWAGWAGQVAYAARTDGSAESYRRAAHEAAVAVEGADAIYIPEGGRAPRAVMGALAQAGVALAGKRVLGSAQWMKADLKSKELDGALFAANDESGVPRTFAYRYEAVHAQKPKVLAALAYDAVALAVSLARRSPGRPWTRAGLESVAGFRGATGLFRFKADGTVERRLAIREVRDGATTQVKAPDATFGNTRYVMDGANALAALRR